MLLKSMFTCILMMVSTSPALADIDTDDINRAIGKEKLEHPYLYFSEEEKPVLLDRIRTIPECRDIMDRLLAEANRLLYTPVDRNIPIQGKNPNADWTEYDRDRKYETYYVTSINNAFTLAFVYQMTGEEKYARKAFEFADAFCDLPSWTFRSHEFPIIYQRIMPWNVDDDQVSFSFDHSNGGSGRQMAAIYDWLYPALTLPQRDRIRGALIEKVITPVRGDYEFHWWATAYRCNWCGVCNAGVGLAGLALLTEDPQLTDVIAESYNRIDKMYSEFGIDGGWQEGGDYWTYGLITSVCFADALKRITHGKYNLFLNERIKNNPVSFPLYISVPHERGYLNFEDSRFNNIFNSTVNHLINKLVTETDSGIGAWFLREFYGNGDDIFDIIWPRPAVESVPPETVSRYFRTIQWWVMRSGFKNPETVVVAGKAGRNDDPHHGHLDAGQFVVYWRNQAFISDLGSAKYDAQYFYDHRWDYPQASSVGHNVIFVNGEKQLAGKMWKKPLNPAIGGDILDFQPSDTRDYVLMDPTDAYPKKELKSWRRHVILEKPHITIVLDEVGAAAGAEIEARFHTDCTAEIHDGYVLLNGDRGIMALIPVVEATPVVRSGRHACQQINALMNFYWIPYFETVVRARGENTIIGTIILPVADDSEAREIAHSAERVTESDGTFKLSFMKDGQTFRYMFAPHDRGLILDEEPGESP